MAPTWGLSLTTWTPCGLALWAPDGFRKLLWHGSQVDVDMAPTWNLSRTTSAPEVSIDNGLPLWGPEGIWELIWHGSHMVLDIWPSGTFLKQHRPTRAYSMGPIHCMWFANDLTRVPHWFRYGASIRQYGPVLAPIIMYGPIWVLKMTFV